MFYMEGQNLSKFDVEEITLAEKQTLDLFIHFIAGRPRKLKKLSLSNIEFEKDKDFNDFVEMLKDLKSLKTLELEGLRRTYQTPIQYLNLIPIFDFLKENTQLKQVSLRGLGIGSSKYDIDNLCNVLLYNETLVSLSVSNNSLTKLVPLMTNLVRNRMSNLLEFDLSHNQIDIDEFVGMITKNNMHRESAFGNLHFKLRILNLKENPLQDMEYKVNQKL